MLYTCAGDSTAPSYMSVAPVGGPLAADGCRAAWLTETSLSHLLFPPTPPPSTPAATPSAARGSPAAAAPPLPRGEVRHTSIDATDVIAAVMDAAEGDPFAGGYQVRTDDVDGVAVRCVSAAMGQWHAAVLVVAADESRLKVASIALVSHITGKVVRCCCDVLRACHGAAVHGISHMHGSFTCCLGPL